MEHRPLGQISRVVKVVLQAPADAFFVLDLRALSLLRTFCSLDFSIKLSANYETGCYSSSEILIRRATFTSPTRSSLPARCLARGSKRLDSSGCVDEVFSPSGQLHSFSTDCFIICQSSCFIFTYLAPDGDRPIYDVAELHDLASLSLVLRKCKPIVEPLMYRTVAITAGKCTEILMVPVILEDEWWEMVPFHVPIAQGYSIHSFLQTRQRRPDLLKDIETVPLLRDVKASTPDALLEDGITVLPGLFDFFLRRLRIAATTGDAVLQNEIRCRRPIRTTLSLSSPKVRTLLQSLYNLAYLDLSRYRTCKTSDPFLSILENAGDRLSHLHLFA